VRFVGLDVHRDFCEIAISEGSKARSAGRVDTTPEALAVLGQSLTAQDKVILESTGNALEIARCLEPFVAEVVIANPMHVRAISHAKVKNDQFDARTLAELLAADLVPRVWIGDEQTRVLRRLTSRRAQLVRARTRTKNEITAVLVRNLKGRSPASDLFGKQGRAWLAGLVLPADEQDTVAACLRQIDFLASEILHVDRQLASYALSSPEIRRLMTIPGVGVTTAATLIAAIGDIDRFPSAKKLVGYLGIDPRVRQSGRGRVVSDQDTRAAARVLSTHPRASRRAGRDRRHRPQARRPLLAATHQTPGLRVQAPDRHRAQTPRPRTARRRPHPPRLAARSWRSDRQTARPHRATAHRTSRTGLPTPHPRLDRHQQQNPLAPTQPLTFMRRSDIGRRKRGAQPACRIGQIPMQRRDV